MIIMGQTGERIWNTDNFTCLMVEESKKWNKYVVAIVHNGDFGNMSVMGRYNTRNEAKYVLGQIYEAIENDTNYELPAIDELPDLTIRRSHGKVTSMNLSYGGS